MNETTGDTSWEYPGTERDILARHDHTQPGYTPRHYPNWSDKKWGAVQHQHKKALRVLADNAINQSLHEEKKEKALKIEKENSLSHLLFVLEKIRNDRQEKAKKAGDHQKETLRNVAQLSSGNKKEAAREFAERASELETMDKKAVALLLSVLQYNYKKAKGKTKKDTGVNLGIVKDAMNKRAIPTEGDDLATLLSTITQEERKKFLRLYE